MRSFTAALVFVGLGPAAAQKTFPSRNITMIVPFAAGGTSDVIARLNAGSRKASEDPAYRTRLSELSAVIASGQEFDPAYVAALVPCEVDKYRKCLSE